MSIPSSPILDFEKAHQVALAENPESKDGFEMWRDLERQAQAAVSPLLAEIEKLKLDLEGTRNDYGSVYAAMCKAQDEGRRLREALTKADGVVQKYVKARDDFYYAESGEVERHYERLVEDAYGYLKGLPDDIRKALGGSK